jgi:WD40 repeat protein
MRRLYLILLLSLLPLNCVWGATTSPERQEKSTETPAARRAVTAVSAGANPTLVVQSGLLAMLLAIVSAGHGDAGVVMTAPAPEECMPGGLEPSDFSGPRLVVQTGHWERVTCAAISLDSRYLLTAGADNTAILWDVKSGREIRRYPIPGDTPRRAGFLAGGELMFVESVDGRKLLPIRPWRNPASDIPASAAFPSKPVEFLGESGESQSWYDHGNRDSRLRLDVKTNEVLLFDSPKVSKEAKRFGGFSAAIPGLSFSRTGNQLIVTFWDNLTDYAGAELWNLFNGSRSWTHTGNSFLQDLGWSDAVGYLPQAVFSPSEGEIVIPGISKRSIEFLDPGTGKLLRKIDVGPGTVDSAVYSRDSKLMLTGGLDGQVRMWELATGREIRHWRGRKALFSPEGERLVTIGADGAVEVSQTATGKPLYQLNAKAGSAFWSRRGDLLFTVAGNVPGAPIIGIWNFESGETIRSILEARSFGVSAALSPNGDRIATGHFDGAVSFWDTDTGQKLLCAHVHGYRVLAIAYSPDGRFLFTGGADGTVVMLDAATGRWLAKFISFRDGSWAVVDPKGRYDASNGGDVEGLHWVVGNTPIALSQLKERYYEPGLLAKVMGLNKEPLRPVEKFEAPKLFPEVAVSPPGHQETKLRIDLKNQGGGIGKVRVLVNGKEIAADARGPSPDPSAEEASLEVDLAGAAVYRGEENKIEVVAWNADGYLSSRGEVVRWQAPGAKAIEAPEVFAIVCGTARYATPAMSLTFSGKDAADIATGIRVSAKRLFGAEKVHLTLLTDFARAKDAQEPSRENLRKAFEEARKAKPSDLLIVYLSGHGATAPDGEYWYLAREARSTDISDPAVRAASGVSSSELTEWAKAIPALKQVMILDTCASGAAAAKLTETRALSSDQIRAIDRMKDRTGFVVLMGSAADAVSYEASQYGQGLLTYALLQGMRGAALREDDLVDVAKLFGYAADQVPPLAKSIGGIQKPVIAAPKGTSFDIGQVKSEDKKEIPLALVRPLILRAIFQREKPPFFDSLGLSKRVNAGLREA